MTGTVAGLVGRILVDLGVTRAFGVVGSGNFHVTNALIDAGATYVAARHEGGAASMADGFARISGTVPVLSLHQGCGLTNAMTGIAEAAKSGTPMVVLAAETASAATRSNFRIDQSALVEAVGASSQRVTGPGTAVDQTIEAFRTALHERRTVVLNLPLDVQACEMDDVRADPAAMSVASVRPAPQEPGTADVEALASLLATARRPVLIAGRGARHAGGELRRLGASSGALLATSAVAKGLFRGDDFDLDISGGFATPLAAELIRDADLVIGFGCALNMWTTRHGRLLGPGTVVAQVDVEPDALGSHLPITLGVVGDSARTAAAVADLLDDAQTAAAQTSAAQTARETPVGYRTPEIVGRLRERRRWRDEAYDDWGDAEHIDPRTLTIGLDDLLPRNRVVAIDSGNFMGYPSMFLDVPDADGFCFTQAFQSVGLGLASGIGAALARPDRLPVVAVGDGGLTMAASELDTVVRLGLPMVVIVYDDGGYGAEVHHFGPEARLDAVTFPPTDHAAIARGHGFDAVTVRSTDDLAGVADWVAGRRERPLLVDAKVAAPQGSWWLEEAFRGH